MPSLATAPWFEKSANVHLKITPYSLLLLLVQLDSLNAVVISLEESVRLKERDDDAINRLKRVLISYNVVSS